MPSILVSHTADDKPLAEALADAIRQVAGHDLKTLYSTSDGPEGPAGGVVWFEWIQTHVANTVATYVLLTPWSYMKPWVLWEAGAAAGVARAQAGGNRRVVPVTFGLGKDEVPNPLQQYQVTVGDTRDGLRKLLSETVTLVPSERQRDALASVERTVDALLTKVRHLMLQMPLTPSEAAIQEWSARIDHLSNSRRLSEIDQLERWLLTAFGRNPDDLTKDGQRTLPIDLRLHRRLAEAFTATRNFERATAHWELCRRLAPRDLVVLRSLGKSLMELGRPAEAQRIVDHMKRLDASALQTVEAAALAARVARAIASVGDAIKVLNAALDANRDSYYLANLLTLAHLDNRQIDEARAAARQTRQIISKLGEVNVWTIGSEATATLIVDGPTAAAKVLDRLAQLEPRLRPTMDQVATIRRGLEDAAKSLPPPANRLQPCLKSLAAVEPTTTGG